MTAPGTGAPDVRGAAGARQPILANSCARAATAAEARFRIDVPIAGRRAARVLALDDGAHEVISRIAAQPWNGARFYAVTGPTGAAGGDLALRGVDGPDTRLAEALDGADVAVMVATAGHDAGAAAAIGDCCFLHGIMTAGLILDDDDRQLGPTLTALRPHARVILVTSDAQDVSEVLTALRA